jgi:hypothetical protein
MVDVLLGRGADVRRAGALWATPLAWALKKGHTAVAEQVRHAQAAARPEDGSP